MKRKLLLTELIVIGFMFISCNFNNDKPEYGRLPPSVGEDILKGNTYFDSDGYYKYEFKDNGSFYEYRIDGSEYVLNSIKRYTYDNSNKIINFYVESSSSSEFTKEGEVATLSEILELLKNKYSSKDSYISSTMAFYDLSYKEAESSYNSYVSRFGSIQEAGYNKAILCEDSFNGRYCRKISINNNKITLEEYYNYDISLKDMFALSGLPYFGNSSENDLDVYILTNLLVIDESNENGQYSNNYIESVTNKNINCKDIYGNKFSLPYTYDTQTHLLRICLNGKYYDLYGC